MGYVFRVSGFFGTHSHGKKLRITKCSNIADNRFVILIVSPLFSDDHTLRISRFRPFLHLVWQHKQFHNFIKNWGGIVTISKLVAEGCKNVYVLWLVGRSNIWVSGNRIARTFWTTLVHLQYIYLFWIWKKIKNNESNKKWWYHFTKFLLLQPPRTEWGGSKPLECLPPWSA